MRRWFLGLALAALACAQIQLPQFRGVVATPQGATATTYYVDPAGSDSANGTTTGTAWQTLAKVNATAIPAGKSVLLKKGGTWRETLTIPSSGTVPSPIAYGAYGASGANPIISGADLKTGWTSAADTPETCTGTCLALADAETNNTTQFTGVTTAGTATFAAGAGSKGHAAYGFSATSDHASNAYAYKTFAAQTTVYARTYFQIATGFTTGFAESVVFLELKDAGGGVNLRCFAGQTNATPTYTYSCNLPSLGYANLTGGTNVHINAGQWYCLEIEFVAAASGGGGASWLDGVAQGSNWTKNSAAMSIVRAEAGIVATVNTPAVGSAIYFDDFKVDSAPIGLWAGSVGGPAGSYKAAQSTFPYVVSADGTPFTNQQTSLAALTAGKWYYSGGQLYVITDDSSDPNSHTMEVGVRQFAVNMNRKTNVSLANITYAGTKSPAVSTPVNDVAAWGDSLTDGTGASVSYPAALASLTGRTVVELGNGGETSTQIATRMLAGSSYYQNLAVIWAGSNNPTPEATVLADVASMISILPTPKRYLILCEVNGNYPTRWSGQAEYLTITQTCVDLANAYPGHVLDIRALLIAQYNAADAEDVIDHGHDVIPASLRSKAGLGGNGGAGTLTSAIGDTTTCTFSISGGGTYYGTLLIGTEKILITTFAGGNVTGCTRGYAGTVAAAHSNGASYVATDTVHLTDAGYAFVAQQVTAWIAAHD